MASERLQKILSNAGVASRRVAEQMILAGRVTVNGTPWTELGSKADPEIDQIAVDGVPVHRGRYRYFALNKPRGVLTASRDARGRKTVIDLLPPGEPHLHPVGRLDLDSEGLVLLTNDGALTDLLTHPRNQVEKEYLVQLDRPLGDRELARLVRGLESDGERLKASSARRAILPGKAGAATDEAWITIVLKQGRKREIRRMVAALGRTVLVLRRVRIGTLHLGALSPGETRPLQDAEVLALYGSGQTTGTRSAGPGVGVAAKSPTIPRRRYPG
jgi:23S rRNA pseudouridine2605 synthase